MGPSTSYLPLGALYYIFTDEVTKESPPQIHDGLNSGLQVGTVSQLHIWLEPPTCIGESYMGALPYLLLILGPIVLLIDDLSE